MQGRCKKEGLVLKVDFGHKLCETAIVRGLDLLSSDCYCCFL